MYLQTRITSTKQVAEVFVHCGICSTFCKTSMKHTESDKPRMNCLHGEMVLCISMSHRTTEAGCRAPPDTRHPLHCMAPPMWGAMHENLRPGCWKILSPLPSETRVVSEQAVREATCWAVPNWCLSHSDILLLGWKTFESETQWVLLVLDRSEFFSFLVLTKRPPDPLTLFTAWRCRDSCRYGCIKLKGMQLSRFSAISELFFSNCFHSRFKSRVIDFPETKHTVPQRTKCCRRVQMNADFSGHKYLSSFDKFVLGLKLCTWLSPSEDSVVLFWININGPVICKIKRQWDSSRCYPQHLGLNLVIF